MKARETRAPKKRTITDEKTRIHRRYRGNRTHPRQRPPRRGHPRRQGLAHRHRAERIPPRRPRRLFRDRLGASRRRRTLRLPPRTLPPHLERQARKSPEAGHPHPHSEAARRHQSGACDANWTVPRTGGEGRRRRRDLRPPRGALRRDIRADARRARHPQPAGIRTPRGQLPRLDTQDRRGAHPEPRRLARQAQGRASSGRSPRRRTDRP